MGIALLVPLFVLTSCVVCGIAKYYGVKSVAVISCAL
jgi:hypothetical protein